MMPLFQACGTVSTPRSRASSAMRSSSVMPPQRVTSGWTRSTWPRSISSRKPQQRRVLLAGGDADVDRVGELGVGLVLVGLERLLEPEDAELLELARDADRRLRVGDVAEAGVDQDRRRRRRRPPSPRRRGATSCVGSLPSGPQPSLTAVKPCSRSAATRLGDLRRSCRASASRRTRAPCRAAASPSSSQTGLPARLALDVPERDVDAADRVERDPAAAEVDQAAVHLVPEPLDVERVLADEQVAEASSRSRASPAR